MYKYRLQPFLEHQAPAETKLQKHFFGDVPYFCCFIVFSDSDLIEKFKTEFDEENGELFLDSLSNHCPNEKIAAQAARLLENIQMNDTDNDMF